MKFVCVCLCVFAFLVTGDVWGEVATRAVPQGGSSQARSEVSSGVSEAAFRRRLLTLVLAQSARGMRPKERPVYYSRKLINVLGMGGLISFGLGWVVGGYYYFANTLIEAASGGPAGAFAVGLIPIVGPILNWALLPQALSFRFHVIMTTISFGVQMLGAAALLASILMGRSNRAKSRRARGLASLLIFPMCSHQSGGVGVMGQF